MIAITSGRKNTIRIWLRIELLTSRLLIPTFCMI